MGASCVLPACFLHASCMLPACFLHASCVLPSILLLHVTVYQNHYFKAKLDGNSHYFANFFRKHAGSTHVQCIFVSPFTHFQLDLLIIKDWNSEFTCKLYNYVIDLIYIFKRFIHQLDRNKKCGLWKIFFVSSLRHCQLSLLINETVNLHAVSDYKKRWSETTSGVS